MEQNEEKNKNPVTSPQTEEPKKEKQPLTEAQRLKRNKLIVYPLMGLLFIGSMWWIFAPSEEDKQKELQSQGFNTEMPLADGMEIIGDKTKAYELGELEARQQSRERAMQDLGDMFKGEADNDVSEDEYSLMNPGVAEEKKTEAPKVQRTVQSSANAYRNLNTTLGSFYEEPKRNDEEVDELKERISMLEAQLESGQNTNSAVDEQLALMEKSYELAARYMGGQNGQGGQVQAVTTPQPTVRVASDKAMATPVKQVHEQVVSALSQPMTNEEFVAVHSQERNYGFHTAVGKATVTDKNTISACVYGNQTITD
ncbi:MAG: conjugative transposon protein TraM, partial [Bacteroidales bacterium]|nr:conjugative transposon protein TraM [Bacteroidales bacterium]